MEIKKILVAVDGSNHAKKAIEMAKQIGAWEKADITLIYVVNDLRAYHPYALDVAYEDQLNSVMQEHSKKVIRQGKEALADYEAGSVETMVMVGDAARAITETAEEEGFHLIVIGSRGLNSMSRLMMGSVSNKVVNNAKCSVYVVR